MTKPIKKIILFLILIIALPILFFLFKEASNLNETEKMIESIYQKQLDAVLFSVNQYSEDLARNWMNRIEAYDNGSNSLFISDENIFKEMLSENPSIKYVFASDTSFSFNAIFRTSGETKNDPDLKKLLVKQNKLVKRLFTYQSANFHKIEPLPAPDETALQYLISISKSKLVYGIAIDKAEFVNKELSSKFISISQSEFSFAVVDTTTNKQILTIDYSEGQKFQRTRNLWMIPDYKMGIALQGKTIDQLVSERNKSNVVLLALLSVVMIVAAWFGFKSIKKEIELAQIKNDFVSNVSHELRTPLALINMFAETLSLGRVKTEEKKVEYYGIIQQETERLSKIVNKILNFAKIEAGKWKYNFAEIELNQIVAKVFEVYKFHLTSNGFEFALNVEEREMKILADAEAISEAVINLLDNALKYSGYNKKVVIKTGTEGKKAFVEVEDSGLGISQEDQKKIFEKFFRVSTKEVHNAKGTGLGLTLVKHIVEANHGEISLKSEPGKGSCFRLTFPLLES
ncbi:MAG: HAMP domain-containing histidine kinase [Ignavibacteriales bacterium]|nr:HAMP domain-containing histidine kinase [Ignavibacteriales bacterium]